MAKLHFLGATRQVTGSCYLLETESSRLLLECGMIQGEPHDSGSSHEPFIFDANSIDAVIVSHAHLDHSGLLPKLVKEGYSGPIYVTTATADLLDIMLKDAAFIQHKDIEWENKRRVRSGKDPVDPVYTIEDVEQTLSQLDTTDYLERKNILAEVELRFQDAGHILGSAIVELWIEEPGVTKKLVFSGDLGNSCSPLLHDPAIINEATVLLLESTYGDRDHKPSTETLEEFQQALDDTYDDGGNVFIPTFAVGRTQEILYRLGQFHLKGKLQQQKTFLDSPMATSVNKVYIQHRELYNHEDPDFNQKIKSGWERWLPGLSYTHSTEESMAINKITGGAIVIAGSGMCTGGRIRHHLKHNLWRRNNHIIFVGFQARGTLGRALVDGAKQVKIMGNDIAVKAKIHTLGGFSAHAGQSQLLTWAANFSNQPRLYLVHGELEKMLALQKTLVEKTQWYANIPAPADVIQL